MLFRRRGNGHPTHGWLIGNRALRWLAGGFIFFTLITVMVVMTITYAIRRDCNNPYHRDLKIAGYWIHIQAGSNDLSCPQR
jgi:hypothetical protein